MRQLYFTVADLVTNWLPPRKRKPVLTAFLTALLAPFSVMMTEFRAWRNTTITKVRVTGETASLQWYLRSLFPNIIGINQIVIETAGVSGVIAGLESTEPTLKIIAGVESTEPTIKRVVGLPGEGTLWGAYSFIVKIPIALGMQEEAIKAVVRSYKLAGKSFKTVFY